MNRLVLFAVLLSQSSLIFCQLTTTPPESPQVPGKVSMGQWPFSLSNGQPRQTAERPSFKGFDCRGPNTAQNQAGVPADLDRLFNAPCTELKSHADLFALNSDHFSQSPLFVEPPPKGEPIPTQWPNAKIERIPTRWPNLKLQPIGGVSAGLTPANPGAK